jgi:AhpD family alkylhydroperoxidase
MSLTHARTRGAQNPSQQWARAASESDEGEGSMQARLNLATVAPGAYEALRGVGRYLRESGHLDHRLLELVFLRVSQMNGCAFCLDMHARALRALGESEERLDLVAGWREAPAYSEREKAALAWAEALTRIAETHAPDEVFARVRAAFSDQELADLSVAIAQINTWNRLMVGFRVPPAARR